MAALTGLDVISAISKKINATISRQDIAEVYRDTPKQGAVYPYAFIHQLDADHKNELRNYGKQSYLIDIRVHPKKGETEVYSWGNTLANKLSLAVNTIEIGGQQVKSTKLNSKVEDGVLHVIVAYSFRVLKVETVAPDMKDLQYGTRTK